MNQFKWRTHWVALWLLACGGGGGGSQGPGDSGGSENPPSGEADCAGVCSALMKAKCFYAGGETDCNRSCTGWETEFVANGPAYCQQAWSDYKTCMTTTAIATCPDQVGIAQWNVMECRMHWDHFNNYCQSGMSPSQPCTDMAMFNSVCNTVPGKPNARSCFGDVPAGCVVGGTTNNSNLYCCP